MKKPLLQITTPIGIFIIAIPAHADDKGNKTLQSFSKAKKIQGNENPFVKDKYIQARMW